MNTLPSTLTATDARTNLYDMLEEIRKYFKRFTIIHKGKPQAVIIPIEELESLEETSEILTIPGAKTSIARGSAQAKKRKGIPLEKLLARAI